MFIVYDKKDKNIWGTGTTKDEAWSDAKEEVSSYFSWSISMDYLALHFRCSECRLRDWKRHISSAPKKAEKTLILS